MARTPKTALERYERIYAEWQAVSLTVANLRAGWEDAADEVRRENAERDKILSAGESLRRVHETAQRNARKFGGKS